jgi:DNA-binding MarR family transcriptional regulator
MTEDHVFVRTMLSALEPFFRIRGTMPASAIQAFLLVAEKEGASVGEYAKRAGIPATTMSRHLLDIGPQTRNHQDGAGLIQRVSNDLNLRERLYFLTPKGRALLAKMQRVRA